MLTPEIAEILAGFINFYVNVYVKMLTFTYLYGIFNLGKRLRKVMAPLFFYQLG